MKIKKLITIFLIICGVYVLSAQNSNYSSYGMGITQHQVSTRMSGLGYSGSAIYDSLGITSYNPALWYGFQTVSLTGKVQYSNMKTTKMQNESKMGILQGFAIKMPVTRYGGFVLGVRPSTRANAISGSNNEINQTKIKGGISDLYFGGGYRITKNLSAGLAARFIFGKYSYTTKTETNSSKYYYNQDQNIRGNIVDMGLFWNIPDQYSIALKYNHPVDFYYNRIIEYNRSSGKQQDNLKNDTTKYIGIDYPREMKIGFTKNISKRLAISSDIKYSESENINFQIPGGDSVNYIDSYLFGIGIERAPSDKFNAGVLDKIYYRLGGFYEQGNIKNDNKKRIEKGITAGIGIPFNNHLNRLDISLNYSETTGFLESDIGKERKLTINLGVTSGGLWFTNALNY